MALVKFGGGITGMSGSIGGTTFARNRYGSYARNRTKPVNPNTALQQNVRAAMAFLTSYWSQTLTAVQRTAWNLYGSNVNMLNRLGETIQLSGFNHFIRSNAWNARYSVAPAREGPTIFELPPADPSFAVTGTEATQELVVSFNNTLPWANEVGGLMQIFQGAPQNAQRNFFNGPWRAASAINGDPVPPASPHTILTLPFAIAEGQHLWIYGRIMRIDGRLSLPFRADVLVAA